MPKQELRESVGLTVAPELVIHFECALLDLHDVGVVCLTIQQALDAMLTPATNFESLGLADRRPRLSLVVESLERGSLRARAKAVFTKERKEAIIIGVAGGLLTNAVWYLGAALATAVGSTTPVAPTPIPPPPGQIAPIREVDKAVAELIRNMPRALSSNEDWTLTMEVISNPGTLGDNYRLVVESVSPRSALKRIKARGSTDPDVDLFLAIYEDDADTLRRAIESGADVNVPLDDVLERNGVRTTRSSQR
ncbi:MAG TPA: hypothetical protein VK157_16100 [Phycisphaerales bacterium]|nr:hypothetical protein [Phycisphaerales bacterium]